MERYTVFLCYSRGDLETVRNLYLGLAKRGVTPWFDETCLKPGRWKPQIEHAIRNSSYFLICISNSAISRMRDGQGFQDEELSYALDIAMNQSDSDYSIIPVRLEECERGDSLLSTYHQFDLFKDWESTLDRLAIAFGGTLATGSSLGRQDDSDELVDRMSSRANVLYLAGEYDRALDVIDEILKVSNTPRFETISRQGTLLLELGRHEEAITAFDRALELMPRASAILFNKALALLQLNHLEEAIRTYARALEISPDMFQGWCNMGAAYLKAGRYEEALRAFEEAISINPRDPISLFNKASVLAYLGRYREAVAYCDRVIYVHPNHTNSWLLKSAILDHLGEPENALATLHEAESLIPNDLYIQGSRHHLLHELGRVAEFSLSGTVRDLPRNPFERLFGREGT